MHVYGAVAPLTGRTPSHISPTLGTGEFAAFLRQLLRYYRDKPLLIMHDRGWQHTGVAVETVVVQADGCLLLEPQPAYSPELNPEERIWKWMRRAVTHNHWFTTLREEIQAIRDFFSCLAGRKAELRQLCTIKTPGSFIALL